MGIERIVRAYALPINTPPRRELKPGVTDAENVTLSIGRDGGSGKTIQGSISSTMTFYLDQSDVEIF
jgi:hypothetical protein